MKTHDMRSPIARERDKFLNSEEGRKLSDPATIRAPKENRQHIENRIEVAFLKGVEVGQRIATKAR